MKLNKTFLTASLVSSVWTGGHANHDLLRKQHRELDVCPSWWTWGTQEPPDGKKSQIVELSYYNENEAITVEVTDGVPDKIFKFSGCGLGMGTKIWLTSCHLGNVDTDPVFTLWTRDVLDYNLETCVDKDGWFLWWDLCPADWHDEKTYEKIAYSDEEHFFKPGLYGDPDITDGTYDFKYSAVPRGPDFIDWPCFPSVTATFVHGSTQLDFDAGENKNIVADFFYTGEYDMQEYDVVIFVDGDDPPCTLGNEVASTDQAYANAPFDISIANVGAYPTEYQRVTLDANMNEWENFPDLWDEEYDDDPKTGRLTFCMQFQVKKQSTKNLVEFVDVDYTIDIDLVQECSCDDPGAQPADGRHRDLTWCWCPCPADEPICGQVDLVRDEVVDVDDEVDPTVPLSCGPCEGNTTVTQGEKFPVCMRLVVDDDDYCIDEALNLDLNVDLGSFTAIFQVFPNPADEILTGDMICDDDGECVIQMIPPADLIAQLEAGNPDSKYTGKFSGAVTLGAGSCDRRRDRQLLGTVVAPFVGEEFTMSFLAKELECPRIFRGGVMCRIWKLLRRLRGSS